MSLFFASHLSVATKPTYAAAAFRSGPSWSAVSIGTLPALANATFGGTFGWGLDLTGQSLSLTFTPVPEPGTLALAGAAAAAGLWRWRRRRRAAR